MLHRYTYTRTEVGGHRHYETPVGTLPSVTSILRKSKDSSGLDAWRRRVGVKHADMVSREASERGTQLHRDLEMFFTEGVWPDEPSGYLVSVFPFLERLSTVDLVEGVVWHPYGFAGAVDLVAQVDGNLAVVDWKTASRPKRKEWIEDYRLQVAAYVAAVNYVYDLSIEHGYIVIAVDNEPVQVFEESGDELSDSWQGFIKRLQAFKP